MNIELARQFLLEFLPADAQIPVNEVWETMKTEPGKVLNNGFIHNHMNYFNGGDKALAVAAVNGTLCGFALAYCMRYPEVIALMENFISQKAKARGDNIVSFMNRKGS